MFKGWRKIILFSLLAVAGFSSYNSISAKKALIYTPIFSNQAVGGYDAGKFFHSATAERYKESYA